MESRVNFMLAISVFFLSCLGPIEAADEMHLKYEAQISDDGEVILVPMESNAEWTGAISEAQAAMTAAAMAGTEGEVFLVQNADGVVTGIFPTQDQAFSENFSPGDSVKVFAADQRAVMFSTGSAYSVAEDGELELAVRETAKRLLEAARDSVCEFDSLPDTVSPTVEVSFGLFAGTSLSISATWRTEEICTP